MTIALRSPFLVGSASSALSPIDVGCSSTVAYGPDTGVALDPSCLEEQLRRGEAVPVYTLDAVPEPVPVVPAITLAVILKMLLFRGVSSGPN